MHITVFAKEVVIKNYLTKTNKQTDRKTGNFQLQATLSLSVLAKSSILAVWCGAIFPCCFTSKQKALFIFLYPQTFSNRGVVGGVKKRAIFSVQQNQR